MNQKIKFGTWTLSFLIVALIIGCSTTRNYSLKKEQLQLVNRKLLKSDVPNAIELNAQMGDGLAIIQDINLTSGTIEIELRGENIPGKSFVGLAFNVQNDSTYEAVYFRAFNFHSPEKIRREHSMQYIAHPEFTWRKLRTESEGVYEAEFPNPPPADDWFKVKIVIDEKSVSVFKQETNMQLLKVNRLTDSKSSKIALWTGFNSKGGFRNLHAISK